MREVFSVNNGEGGHDDEKQGQTGVLAEVAPKVRLPPMYRVILLNDDYTPMDFVVSTIVSFFNKTQEAATEIMLKIHYEGRGVCGVYPYEIAETKAALVMDDAKKNGYPLQAVLERD